ncbi:transposase [Micromonospora sp. A202]|uniref:transposase n=1 Tax=Micromonospora sp. A202 TaxID=2572899 RepID=UPI001C8A1EA1|nr:transposase [Micromonospora sp. A202]
MAAGLHGPSVAGVQRLDRVRRADHRAAGSSGLRLLPRSAFVSQVERLCHTDVAFKVLCAGDIPDHATIARFRAGSEDAFAGLFTQVLMIAARAGLARFGTITIDGTKIPANASIDANRGRDWFDQQATQIVTSNVEEAAGVDAFENAQAPRGGGDSNGDRVPARRPGPGARAVSVPSRLSDADRESRR